MLPPVTLRVVLLSAKVFSANVRLPLDKVASALITEPLEYKIYSFMTVSYHRFV